MDYRKRMWSLLALTGLTTSGIAAWQPQQSLLRILKGEPNRLTLQFRGQKPATVEVIVDGMVVATRHLRGQTDRLQLNLYGAGLAPGSHEATIKLYDADGRLLSESRTRIELLPDPNSPLTIIIPRNGSQVAGVTPIEARVNRSGAYVSFFIDGQVRGLRNYPPYVYNWDTTRETNGWHTIEVWSYDGNQTFKTPPMRVYVNNPGGRTERQVSVEAEMNPAAVEPAATAAVSEPAASPSAMRPATAPEARPHESVRLSAPAAPVEPAKLPAAPAVPRAVEPSVSPEPTEPTPALTPSVSVAAPQFSPNRLNAPQDEPSLQAVPAAPVRAVATARATDAEPLMRGQKLRAPSTASAPAPEAAAPAPERAWLSLEIGARLPETITQFEIVLDGALLSSDVAPQAEQGVALVPARHVLEQLGARLHWDHQQKVAHAELHGQQIALRVRENAIEVNGRAVPADARLRIVRGRILMPATALRDLLNAEVAFDLQAQQLVISTGQ
ncbi:MAG: stalk domain-containing protein [Fimbriimonadales bacterium]|nr:stalk domain-containing protein [Fimbriimonadales bacterium]